MSAVASRVWLCAGHGPGSDLDALKAYLMMSIMYDPTQDDDQLISDFLAAYYGALAAPWIRLYMVRSTGCSLSTTALKMTEGWMGRCAGQDTMHGSIADTNYYMRESFDHTATFLTPIALITSADALAHAHKLTDDESAERERVEVAKLAVCESSIDQDPPHINQTNHA